MMLSLVRCGACGGHFNGRSGRSVKRAVRLYTLMTLLVLVLLMALAQSLRDLPSVQAFIKAYPGIAQSAPSVDTGFPWWLQLQHFLNMLFMMFIIRAGIQILADHPRLYWNRDCTPGTEWFRFQHPEGP